VVAWKHYYHRPVCKSEYAVGISSLPTEPSDTKQLFYGGNAAGQLRRCQHRRKVAAPSPSV
jgi:hypothetical protein